ncbi:MAG: rhodanese-like domain-containing protein [Chthoniobacterales bacterium]
MRTSVFGQAILLIGVAFLPAIGQALFFRGNPALEAKPPDAHEVTLAQAKSWGDAVLWVDARPEEEFEKAHVPGALSLNEDRFAELLPPVLAAWSPERKIVVYCSRKSCGASHAVAERLRNDAQLKNVYVLPGGWEEWQENQ